MDPNRGQPLQEPRPNTPNLSLQWPQKHPRSPAPGSLGTFLAQGPRWFPNSRLWRRVPENSGPEHTQLLTDPGGPG